MVTIQKIETFSVLVCLLLLPVDGTVLPSSVIVTGHFDTKLFRYKFIHSRCK